MKDLVALITGGGSGIGLATAKEFLSLGVKVVIAGRVRTRLVAACEELAVSDDSLLAVTGDVSSEGYANKLVKDTLDKFGSLHILVNNAGVFRGGSILDMTEEDYDLVMGVNLKGTWLMCRQAASAMKESGFGSIVNVSSLLAHRAVMGFPSGAYAASKGGITSLTKALAVELAPYKIRVNSVAPALVKTPMLNSLGDGQLVERMLAKAYKYHPIGKAGEPHDVARVIAFLSCPENSWLTGTEISIDGGRSAI